MLNTLNMTELTRAFLLSVYTLGVLLFLCSLNAFAEQTKPIHIPAGLYQGIQGETARYTLLEFKDNGQHSLINLHIATSFRKGEIHQFTNEQVNCSPLLCLINVATQQGEQINLHLAPYLETGFNVLEVIAGNNGKVLLSSHYTLVHRQGQSTPRSFMEKYSQQLMAQTPLASNSVYGFWLEG
ncbi:hypothetical protein PULV_b0105 [Pseudoalteromonas ulvae UL12]|nr:hypothetical protein [Pseudoalteromonas ulvae UL12]